MNAGKATELQVATWFLEAEWNVYLPLVDSDQIDLVVVDPKTKRLWSLQVKHSERQSRNPGFLDLRRRHSILGFDYLVFYVPAIKRGVILPRKRVKPGHVLVFVNPRTMTIKPAFSQYAFDHNNFVSKFATMVTEHE